jgi:transposase
MLRRVEKEDLPISAVAASFGFSRPAFYKARRDFISEGLGGLIARRRGPKEGHKVTREIVSFVERTRAQESSIAMPELVRRIQNEFAVLVHRRSVERALVAAKKKRGKA